MNINIRKCQHCGAEITPDLWCFMHRGKYPPLWIAREAAQDCGVSKDRMKVALAKSFLHRRLRLGKDVNDNTLVTVYCLWPSYGSNFMRLPARTIAKLWSEQHQQRPYKEML